MPEFTDKFAWHRSLAGAGLTDPEFRLLVLMANYADGTTGKRITVGYQKLADDLGKNVKTVKRTVPKLIDKGWLYLVEERPGRTNEYGLSTPTGDTQMSPVTSTDQEHSDVPTSAPTGDISEQGGDTQMSPVTSTDQEHSDVPTSAPTGDISEQGGDTQMSPHRGHPDVPRSDQLTDHLSGDLNRDRSDQFRVGDIPEDVPTGESQDETGLEAWSLAVAGSEHPTEEHRPVGLLTPTGYEPASAGSSAVRTHGYSGPGCIDNPFCDNPSGCDCSQRYAS